MSENCHVILLPPAEFAELRAGKPLLICKDLGQCAGDLLIASEYDDVELRRTGVFALVRITWVTRGADNIGLLESLALEQLVPQGAVLLTHEPVEVVTPAKVVGDAAFGQPTSHQPLRGVPADAREPEVLVATPSADGPGDQLRADFAGPASPDAASTVFALARREFHRLRRIARGLKLEPRAFLKLLQQLLELSPGDVLPRASPVLPA
jgi:hypothetical protein